MLNIKDLITKDTTGLTASVEFRDGMILDFRYMPREKLQQISKECEVLKYDSKTRSRRPEIDGKRFAPP